MEAWTIEDAMEQYLVRSWGAPAFSVNPTGNVQIAPRGDPAGAIDLKELVDNLVGRGLQLPILLRFDEILKSRIQGLAGAFERAIAEYEYENSYTLIMPIKVNQQRHVVEKVLEHGRSCHVGLEAGSKPELYIAMAMVDDPDALIICNGYKDNEFLETALLAQKLDRQVVIVVDRFQELHGILEAAKRLGLRPRIGVRAKLSARGSGKWIESAGERSKFGLTASELVQAVEMLLERGMADCLELLHFHLGSQINNIGAIKVAMREGSQLYVDLRRLGAGLKYLDVGGGLAVDYDGSRTNYLSSRNYSVQEYANDVVATIGDACAAAKLAPPTIISESGRAICAHHAVLIFEVLGVNSRGTGEQPSPPTDDDHNVMHLLWQTFNDVSRKTYQQAFNDLLELRQEAQSLYVHGVLDLRSRAWCEEVAWQCAQKIRRTLQQLEYVPEDLANLEKEVSDTYFCNFSVFQSAPDHWAVKQLFPVMPIHRLGERPTRPATIADLTCDSDGKIDRFIDLHDVRDTLLLHPLNSEPYYLGLFLVGAYQEVLGDLHNLFGDTHAVQVSLDEDGYDIDTVVTGETVAEVLGYMQYERREMTNRLRAAAERALRKGHIRVEDVRMLMKVFEAGLGGYTYLEEE